MILKIQDEQRRIVAYLDGLLAKVNALRESVLRDDVREPRKGVILQVKGGAPKGCDKGLSALMVSVLDRAFKGSSNYI